MRRDLLLAVRLIRGSGRRGATQVLLTVVGIAFGLVCVVNVAQIPSVLAARTSTAAARTPLSAAGGVDAATTAFGARTVDGAWRGEAFTRVFLDGPASATAPPGLSAFPRPGEAYVSPAARRLLDDPAFRATVPGRVVGTISEDGLLDPGELIAYVGARPSGTAGRHDAGWGRPVGPDQPGSEQYRFIALEQAVLIVPAALLYLLAVSRLAAATRRKRYAALRLAGAGAVTLRRVAIVETLVGVVPGLALGLLAHAALEPWLASSGVTGLRWFPDRVGLGTLVILAAVVLAIVAVRVSAAAAVRSVLERPLQARRGKSPETPRIWRAIPLLLGLGLLLPALPCFGAGSTSALVQTELVAGAALAALGTVSAAALIASGVAGLALRLGLPLGARIGVHRILADPGAAARLVAGLGIVVVVAGTGSGIAASAERGASQPDHDLRAHVYAVDVPIAARDELAGLVPDGSFWATAATGPAYDQMVLVAPCATLRGLLDIATCAEGSTYRVRSGGDVVRPGMVLSFPGHGEPDARITAPPAVLDAGPRADVVLASTTQVVIASRSWPGAWPQIATFYFDVPPTLPAIDAFTSELSRIAPEATVNLSIDWDALRAARVHQHALRFGTWSAYLLGLVALVITLLDLSIDRRAVTVALTVVGARARTHRAAQVTHALIPLAVTAVLGCLVGFVIANALASIDAPHPRWYAEPLAATLPMIALGLLLVAGVSLVVFGARLRPEDLRHE